MKAAVWIYFEDKLKEYFKAIELLKRYNKYIDIRGNYIEKLNLYSFFHRQFRKFLHYGQIKSSSCCRFIKEEMLL